MRPPERRDYQRGSLRLPAVSVCFFLQLFLDPSFDLFDLVLHAFPQPSRFRIDEPSERNHQTYLDYDEGPLTISSGKPAVVRELAQGKRGRKMMIGDGASDLATRAVVDLFVGFGGVVARQKVRDEADVFVGVNSLAPILPLAAGLHGYVKALGTPHQPVFERGLALIREAGITMKNPDLHVAFEKAFEPDEE